MSVVGSSGDIGSSGDRSNVGGESSAPSPHFWRPIPEKKYFTTRQLSEYELTFIRRESKDEENDLGFQAFTRFHDCVDAVVRAGWTQESDTRRLTQQLWAGAHGLVVVLLLRPGYDWGNLDLLIAGHVAMLMRGLQKPFARDRSVV